MEPMRFVLTAVVLAIVVLALLLVLVWASQERMVFQPPNMVVPAPTDVDRTDLTTPAGQPLFYYLVRAANADTSAPLILVFHGNADLAVWQIPWAREVARRTGAIIALAEYRGYAGLPGSPTYATAKADAYATWTVLVQRLNARAERTVLYGHSLGSAIAAELAAEIGPRALLLESPFTSARAMAARMPVPGLSLFWRAISRVHYDTRARVASLDLPVSVAHGARDGIIPVHMGREVHAAAKCKGELLIVPDAGHNDLREVGGDEYWAWLLKPIRVMDRRGYEGVSDEC